LDHLDAWTLDYGHRYGVSADRPQPLRPALSEGTVVTRLNGHFSIGQDGRVPLKQKERAGDPSEAHHAESPTILADVVFLGDKLGQGAKAANLGPAVTYLFGLTVKASP
jgi:hypothetical protein